MSNYSYTINFDINLDAWNWYSACNGVGFGVDWKQGIDSHVAENIVGKTESEAYEFLVPYIKRLCNDNNTKRGEAFIRQRFEDDFANACTALEKITGKPLYRNDFCVRLTTFPRGPYNYEKGEFWLPIQWTNPIANFMHEVLHFQTIHYWRNNPTTTMSRQSDDDFETLKEALTVVLDDSLVPPLEKPDVGYAIHGELRAVLHKHWQATHDFSDLIDFGVERFANNRSEK